VSLGDTQLDISGISGLRDALTRVVAAGVSVDYHAVVSLLVSKISRARGFVFENHDLGHSWPQFAAKTVGSFGDMEAAQTTVTCSHVSAIVENLGAFEDAVIRAEAFACRMAGIDGDAGVLPVRMSPAFGQPPTPGAVSALAVAVASPQDADWTALRADVQALTLLVSQGRGHANKSQANTKDNNKSRRPVLELTDLRQHRRRRLPRVRQMLHVQPQASYLPRLWLGTRLLLCVERVLKHGFAWL
jgi:hypothetical protein